MGNERQERSKSSRNRPHHPDHVTSTAEPARGLARAHASGDNGTAPLPQESHKLKDENRQLRVQLAQAKEEITHLSEQLAVLAQLNLARTRQEAITTISEVLANFIGTEEFACLSFDKAQKRLEHLFSTGVDESRVAGLRIDTAPIKDVLRGTSTVVRNSLACTPSDIIAAVPLCLGNEPVGVIVIFGLLPQKNGLERKDYAFFDLLTAHAAPAITTRGKGIICQGNGHPENQ